MSPKLGVWSTPLVLHAQALRVLPQGPGVYRVRIFHSEGRPVPIHRLRGTDPEGVLHIGQSQDLKRRVGQFLRSAARGNKNHHAGNEFFYWGFATDYPVSMLRLDYIVTATAREAIDRERYFHEAYRRRHFDRPPLDGTSGQPSMPWSDLSKLYTG